MVTTLTVVAALAVAVSVSLLAGAAAVRLLKAPGHVYEGSIEGARANGTREIAAELEALKVKVDALPSLWESERQRAEDASDRAKGRLAAARAAESRARRAQGESDDDDDGWGDEDEEIPDVDARVGSEQRVRPVREDVGESPQEDLTKRALASGWSPWL